jgi:hypothetical protein
VTEYSEKKKPYNFVEGLGIPLQHTTTSACLIVEYGRHFMEMDELFFR